MRQISAWLAIVAAMLGAAQLILGRGDTFALTAAVYTVALFASGIAVLRGAPMIYLATSWGIYIGTTLTAYLDVEATFSHESGPVAIFGLIALSALIVLEVLGLASAIVAYRRKPG